MQLDFITAQEFEPKKHLGAEQINIAELQAALIKYKFKHVVILYNYIHLNICSF